MENRKIGFTPKASVSADSASDETVLDGPRYRRAPSGFRLHDVGSLLRDRQRMRWMIEGWLPEQGLAILWGAPGIGKSFAALDIALSLAAGRCWLTGETDMPPRPAIYWAGEGEWGYGPRLRAWMVHTGLGEAALQDRFHLATARTSNFGKSPCDAASLLHIEVDRLRETHEAAPLVVIDTVASVSAQMDENDASSVGPFLKACQTIVGQRGDPPATVLLVHHGAKHNGASPRGHSKFTGNPDVVIAARRQKDGLVLEVQKQRYAAAPPARAFKMAPVSLETGDDALVLVDAAPGAASPAAAAETAEKRTVEKTSGARPTAGAECADALLVEILRDGLTGSERTTMTLKAIHAAYEKAALSHSIAATSKPTVLRRLRELVRRGLVVHAAGARGGAYRLKR